MLIPMGEKTVSTRQDFRFADGLRAIAALGVALYHAYVFTGMTGDYDKLPVVFQVISLGNYAVPIFIVLSGFVLMLPVAKSDALRFRAGTAQFIKRRARRILPPYFVAMAIFFVIIWAIPLLQERSGTAWDTKVPITPGGVISHIFLVHNFSLDWVYQMNGPAWSVATEWQIYFAMPFLLLPLWRKLGAVWTVTIAVLIGWAIHFIVPSVDVAHFWFLGLFAFGMAAAYIVVRGIQIPYLGRIISVLGPIAVVIIVVAFDLIRRVPWLTETALGVIVALSLVWLSQCSMAGKRSLPLRLLESRPLVWIGAWSYSAYLIHSPILALGNLLLLPLALPLGLHFGLMVAVALPVALGCGYVFHLLVERHFMTSHQAKATHTPEADQPSTRREPTPSN
jgi:peptidoglycan/LPS O-acetylase OafA/YrhL